MRLRRRHRDDWSLPSGLAEVELFRFWEADLADTLPPDVLAFGPPPARPALPARPVRRPSPVPLWVASAVIALLVVLTVLL